MSIAAAKKVGIDPGLWLFLSELDGILAFKEMALNGTEDFF